MPSSLSASAPLRGAGCRARDRAGTALLAGGLALVAVALPAAGLGPHLAWLGGQAAAAGPAAGVPALSGTGVRLGPPVLAVRVSAPQLLPGPSGGEALSLAAAPPLGPPVPRPGPAALPRLGPPAPAGVRPVARPTSVTVPAIGLRSAVQERGALPDGSMQVPDRFDVTGWYSPGPAPGEPGAAVLAGHVDSYRGPAVFFRLRELVVGDLVLVGRADGSTARFAVDRTARYPKDRFDTDAVFGGVAGSELRLITCAGRFDRDSGHYRDNLVVYASLIHG